MRESRTESATVRRRRAARRFVVGMTVVAFASVGCGDDAEPVSLSEQMLDEAGSLCDPFDPSFDQDAYESGSCTLAMCDRDSKQYDSSMLDECPEGFVENLKERATTTTEPEGSDESADSDSSSTDAPTTTEADDAEAQSASSAPDSTTKTPTRTVPKTTTPPTTTTVPPTTSSAPPTTKKPVGATTTLPRVGGTSTLP